jgi:hypothetical protein
MAAAKEMGRKLENQTNYVGQVAETDTCIIFKRK